MAQHQEDKKDGGPGSASAISATKQPSRKSLASSRASMPNRVVIDLTDGDEIAVNEGSLMQNCTKRRFKSVIDLESSQELIPKSDDLPYSLSEPPRNYSPKKPVLIIPKVSSSKNITTDVPFDSPLLEGESSQNERFETKLPSGRRVRKNSTSSRYDFKPRQNVTKVANRNYQQSTKDIFSHSTRYRTEPIIIDDPSLPNLDEVIFLSKNYPDPILIDNASLSPSMQEEPIASQKKSDIRPFSCSYISSTDQNISILSNKKSDMDKSEMKSSFEAKNVSKLPEQTPDVRLLKSISSSAAQGVSLLSKRKTEVSQLKNPFSSINQDVSILSKHNLDDQPAQKANGNLSIRPFKISDVPVGLEKNSHNDITRSSSFSITSSDISVDRSDSNKNYSIPLKKVSTQRSIPSSFAPPPIKRHVSKPPTRNAILISPRTEQTKLDEALALSLQEEEYSSLNVHPREPSHSVQDQQYNSFLTAFQTLNSRRHSVRVNEYDFRTPHAPHTPGTCNIATDPRNFMPDVDLDYEGLLRLGEQMGDVKSKRVSEPFIRSIHPIMYLNGSLPAEEAQCTICIEDYVKNVKIKRLPCLHTFHSTCIDIWMRKGDSCPVYFISKIV